MFTRIQDYQDRQKKHFDEAEPKGRTEGIAEIYQELAEWNNRCLAAEARNEPFTEQFPSPPEPSSNQIVIRDAVGCQMTGFCVERCGLDACCAAKVRLHFRTVVIWLLKSLGIAFIEIPWQHKRTAKVSWKVVCYAVWCGSTDISTTYTDNVVLR